MTENRVTKYNPQTVEVPPFKGIHTIPNYPSEDPLPAAQVSAAIPNHLNEIRLLQSKQQQTEGCNFLKQNLEYAAQEDSLKVTAVSEGLLTNILTPGNFFEIRERALQTSTALAVSACDAFIRTHFDTMLGEKELLSLPRVQINLDVSEQEEEIGCADTGLTMNQVTAVVKELSSRKNKGLSSNKGLLLEERVVEMKLLSDLSVQVVGSDKKSTKFLSPEKPLTEYIRLAKRQPSPVHWLQLESENSSEDSLDENKDGGSWVIVATHNLSGISAICLVQRPQGLIVLNIQMILKISTNALCPVSPTTGIPIDVSSVLISQMVQARGGFGLISLDNSLMSVGGFNRSGVLSNTECFKCDSNSWVSSSSELITGRARFVAVKCDDEIYAIGGSDGRFELDSVEQLTPNQSWKTIPAKLSIARSDFGSTALNGCIYAIGGVHYSRPLRSVEVFGKDHQWKSVASMNISRKGLAVASCNGKVYAIGGQTSNWSCLDSVECYNPENNEWSKVASMSMPRRNASAVTYKDRIFVIGGYDGTSAVSCVEAYNPTTDTWTSVSPMMLKRSSAAAVLIENTIYVVGGFSGKFFLNSVEKFDVLSEQWSSYVSS